MADLQTWENGVLGKVLDTDNVAKDAGQCSQVPISWAEYCFPGIVHTKLLPAANGNGGVDTWADRGTAYFTWIANNPSDRNQLPLPGDVIVFGATPAKGFTMTYENPYGHAAVVKAASVSGYTIVEQNEPVGSGVHDGSYPWSLRPALGWFRPNLPMAVTAPATPSPAPVAAAAPVMSPNVGKTLVFPASVKSWWTYNPGGPYDDAHHAHVLSPSKFGGISEPITADLGNGIYVISTSSYGLQAIKVAAPLTVR